MDVANIRTLLLWLLAATAGYVHGRSVATGTDHDGLSSDTRVMGGSEATDGQFPYTVDIKFNGSLGWTHWCTAILIKTTYALTSAKCIDGRNVADLRAWAGLFYLNDTAATNAQLLTIDSVHIHEEYSGLQPFPNDIAIIRFLTPADTSRPNIDLAVLPTNSGNDFVHGGCFINGWGQYTDEHDKLSIPMLYTQLPVIGHNDCQNRLDSIDGLHVLSTHMCTLSDPAGRGMCNGDSGIPLSCYPTEHDHSQIYVVGLASWMVKTDNKCNMNYPSVYTALGEYLDWIEDNTP